MSKSRRQAARRTKARAKGSATVVADIMTPELHEGQRRMAENRERFNVVIMGRRFGKTTFMRSEELLMDILVNGGKVGLFAPVFKDVKELWKAIVKSIDGILIETKDETAKALMLVTGGLLEFWSLKDQGLKDAGRGRDYDLVIYEETQKIKTEILEHHWQNAARPTLADRIGGAWFFGTPPATKRHFFYKLAQRGVANAAERGEHITDIEPQTGFDDFTTFKGVTGDNPHIPKSEILAASKELPALVFAREFLAQCLEMAGETWVHQIKETEIQKRLFVRNRPFNFLNHSAISFDFNKSPAAAILADMSEVDRGGTPHIIRQFGVPEGSKKKVTIYYVIEQMKSFIYQETGVKVGEWDGINYPNPFPIQITGDATGRTWDPRQNDPVNFFDIIRVGLGLTKHNFKYLFTSNPTHKKSQLQINTYIECSDMTIDDKKCPGLRSDLFATTAAADGFGIDKKAYDPHYLDCLRYLFYAFMPLRYTKFLK